MLTKNDEKHSSAINSIIHLRKCFSIVIVAVHKTRIVSLQCICSVYTYAYVKGGHECENKIKPTTTTTKQSLYFLLHIRRFISRIFTLNCGLRPQKHKQWAMAKITTARKSPTNYDFHYTNSEQCLHLCISKPNFCHRLQAPRQFSSSQKCFRFSPRN